MTAVVLDTNVFGADLSPSGAGVATLYAALLAERRLIISFVTVAELEYGASRAGWGPRRVTMLRALIDDATVVWPGPGLVRCYAMLRATCAAHGHGLAEQTHEADRWIAATATFLGIPLVTHDGVFRGTPGLEVITLVE